MTLHFGGIKRTLFKKDFVSIWKTHLTKEMEGCSEKRFYQARCRLYKKIGIIDKPSDTLMFTAL